MRVVVKAQPWRAVALFQYLDLIYRAYDDFAGQVWFSYNEAFHMRSAIHPNLRWDEPLAGLWLWIMIPARPSLGDRTDNGHLIGKTAVNVAPHGSTGQMVQPRLVCWEYNAKGVCTKKQCRFKHECTVCGGLHPSASCFRVGMSRQTRGQVPERNPTAEA